MRLRLQHNLTEGLLVLSDVLAQDIEERLGLLWADVDALGVFDSDLLVVSWWTRPRRRNPKRLPGLARC